MHCWYKIKKRKEIENPTKPPSRRTEMARTDRYGSIHSGRMGSGGMASSRARGNITRTCEAAWLLLLQPTPLPPNARPLILAVNCELESGHGPKPPKIMPTKVQWSGHLHEPCLSLPRWNEMYQVTQIGSLVVENSSSWAVCTFHHGALDLSYLA